ncbi:MAG TPA: ATP-binding protein [Kofleriaceae bacterium]|nr:ATP-binding protein [Kofleriaceae bacterium]
MAWKVVIAHAEGEEHHAERLAGVLSEEGYEVAHRGTVLVGESFTEEASKALTLGGPVVVCGTIKAAGTRWARTIVRSVESGHAGRVRIFPVRLEAEADLEALAGNVKVADCHRDFRAGINELLVTLRQHYPVDERSEFPEHSSGDWADVPTRLSVYDVSVLKRFRAQLRPRIQEWLPDALDDRSFLRKAGLLAADGSLTRAGALIVGEQPEIVMPSARAVCTHYDGVKRTAEAELVPVHGPLPKLIQESLQFLTKRIAHREQQTPGIAEPRIEYEYPMIAVREILANAFCHRRYDDDARHVHVRLFADRIEVLSPGEWVGRAIDQVGEIELGALAMESVRRNARVASVLAWARLVEEEGSGIPRAVENCLSVGARSPTVEQRDGYTVVVIRPRTGWHRATVFGASSQPPTEPERHEVFIGRDAELSRIGAALDRGSGRMAIVAVQGMAGIGKTYLAHEFYARHPGRFGSYKQVVLDPERPGTVATSTRVLGERLRIDVGGASAAAVAEALRAERALVHVDNVDSSAAAELVAALARVLDGVPMVVTGRYTELGTATGSAWTRIELAPFDPVLGLDLLRAELDGIGIVVPEADLRELVRQLAGHPLALHLAAGYLRGGMTVERFLARLREKGFALSPHDPADHVLGDRTRGVLATSFAISRELLLEAAGVQADAWKAALTALGWASRVGFGRSLGAAITGLDELSGAFEDFIHAAASLALVRRLRPEERATAAWAVHPLLGEFLRVGTERAEVDARIGRWVVERAEDSSSERAARWDALAVETAAIGEWLGVATDAVIGEILPRTWNFATSRGPVGPWLVAAQRVRQSGATRDVLWALCQLAFRVGELEIVRDAATEMQRLAWEAHDDRDQALALEKIADVLAARGELDEALRIRREDLAVYERLGDVRSRALTLGQIADVLAARGELDEALRIWREDALPVYEQLDDVRERALTLGQIADVLAVRGELDEALRIRRDEELPVYERLGDVRARAITLGKIADVLAVRGELDEALRIRRDEELPVYERLGDVRARAITLGRIADVLAARGELDEALRIRRDEELPVYERLGDVRARAITLGQIADVLAARGELDEALRLLREEALPVFERLGDVRARAITQDLIAFAFLRIAQLPS